MVPHKNWKSYKRQKVCLSARLMLPSLYNSALYTPVDFSQLQSNWASYKFGISESCRCGEQLIGLTNLPTFLFPKGARYNSRIDGPNPVGCSKISTNWFSHETEHIAMKSSNPARILKWRGLFISETSLVMLWFQQARLLLLQMKVIQLSAWAQLTATHIICIVLSLHEA